MSIDPSSPHRTAAVPPHLRADTILESISEGFYVVDREWRFVYINAAAERHFARARSEMIGGVIWDLLPHARGTEFERLFRGAMADQRAAQFEIRSPSSLRWLDVRIYPWSDGVSVFFRDVTDRRETEEKLQRSEAQLRLITDALPVLIAYVDADGRYRFNNATYGRWFGQPPEALHGRQVREVVGDHAYDAVRPAVDGVLAGVPQSFETHLSFAAHGERDVAVKYVPHEVDGRVVGYVGLVEDITERKRAEQVLHDADHRRSEFLATLAHELRNPLAPIRNAAQLIRLKSPPIPELQRAREMIDRQVDHLTRLVDDLLDVSRITHGKLELQRQSTAVSSVVDYAIEMTRPLIEARKHTLDVQTGSESIFVQGDPARLAQAISNILTNAAKFTEPGGRITVNVRSEHSNAVIAVKDTGIGMEPTLVPYIFDLFTQGNRALDRAQGGLGIGLSLVKRLVELHGGAVEARSEGPGRGSEFVVRLPLAAPAQVEACSVAPHAAPGRRRRVLIVDDNKDSADSLAALVSLEQHVVQTAYSGPAALGAARVFKPELVFLDIGLPGMDGYEVARRLRQFPETMAARLIALTGYGQPRDRERSREAGFDHHAVKPLDPADLRTLLG